MTFALAERALKRAAGDKYLQLVHAGAPWRALQMRVYEAKIVYSLVALGNEVTLNSPELVRDYLQTAFEEYPLQEVFYAVYLDRKNHPIARHMISLGTVSSTLVGMRETFRGAILAGAAGMVVAHNHPSGDPSPSNADLQITRNLREAARIIGIPVEDHVIIGHEEADPNRKGWYSFRNAGLI